MSAFSFPLLLALSSWHWTPQANQSVAGLRGLSAVSSKVGWASGTHGTVLRTIDAGQHWEPRTVAGAEVLDFRDVEAFDKSSAVVMSSGEGPASRVYVTQDGGAHFTLALTNPDQKGFFDAMKFWDRSHGLLLGDPVGGRFTIFLTKDGGKTWTRASGPEAKPDEGAFAASGGCLRTLNKQDAWFGSGGVGVARVFHTSDKGNTWSVTDTPLAQRTASSGIFSLLLLDRLRGIAVGGDYQKPGQTTGTVAITNDGGQTWSLPNHPLAFRSGLTYLKHGHIFIAVGTSGSDYSLDLGRTWRPLSHDVLNTAQGLWAAGAKGLILRLDLRP